MISIAVIAAVIGTTELLFELLDNYERKHHDRNHSKSPSVCPTDGTPQGLQRAQRLQTQPDEAGDGDARSRSSRAVGPPGTASPTSPLIKSPASNGGFLCLIDQPALSNRTHASTYVLARVALNGQAMPSTA